MQVKRVQPMNFLSFNELIAPTDVAQNIKNVAMALHLEAAKKGYCVTGPIYLNHDKNQFVEVSIPVGEATDVLTGQFLFRRSEEFKCLSFVHAGNRDQLPEVIRKLYKYIDHHQLGPTTRWREIHINTDFNLPDANVTEIQLEIIDD